MFYYTKLRRNTVYMRHVLFLGVCAGHVTRRSTENLNGASFEFQNEQTRIYHFRLIGRYIDRH